METVEDVTRVRLVGGNLALDFVNTRTGPPIGPPDGDVLTDYSALVDWGVYAGALTEAEAATSRRLARADSDAADLAFEWALSSRTYLDELFRALASGKTPSNPTLSRLREDEAAALGHAQLEPGRTYAWTWAKAHSLEGPLWPVVHAAAQFLTMGDLNRIKGCGGCRFLFVDETKNGSRRWCSMDDCGTTEKMRRYVAARRARATR